MRTRLRSSRGQLVALLLLLLPVCIVVLVALVDVAVVVVTKARLQVAADLAVLEAGQTLSERMDELAQQNWEIHREFVTQEREFAASQQQNESGGETKIRHRQIVIDQLRGKMHDVMNVAYRDACDAALDVANAEVPWAEMLPLYGGTRVVDGAVGRDCVADAPIFSFYGDQVRNDQWTDLEFTFPDGGADWEDPADVDDGADDLLRYRTKATGPDQQVAFALRLRAPAPHGPFRELFTEQMTLDDTWIAASAAAQPIGGSIEDAAFLDTDDSVAMEAQAEENGLFYDTTLVPLDRLQQRELGYQGLRYFDATEGWVEDEAFYLQ